MRLGDLDKNVFVLEISLVFSLFFLAENNSVSFQSNVTQAKHFNIFDF